MKAGAYKWKHKHENHDKFPVPSIMKKMKKMNITNVNVTAIFYTVINDVKVHLISDTEIDKITVEV